MSGPGERAGRWGRLTGFCLSSLLFVSATEGGCGTARRGPPVAADNNAAPESPPAMFVADAAPIRALAFSAPFLWIGSERGLRRVRLPGDTAEWVNFAGAPVGHRVSALAVDRAGRLLVATETGVVRTATSDAVAAAGVLPAPLLVSSLAGATHLVPVSAAGAGDGVWAGTVNGLFYLEHGRATPVADVGSGAVTSLDVDGDGRSAWAGVRGRGLLHVDVGKRSERLGEDLDLVESLGTALLPNGTRIALGRDVRGESRLVLMRLNGAEGFVLAPDLSAVALIAGSDGPLLLAGRAGLAGRVGRVEIVRTYRLVLVPRGQVLDEALRFTPLRKNLQGLRLVAVADGAAVPPDVTVGASANGQVFVGTRAWGVARLMIGAAAAPAVPSTMPRYLPAGELALDARALSVACRERESCVFATGTGIGWMWDGRDGSVKPIPDAVVGGTLMAVAGDGSTAPYFIATKGKTLVIGRLGNDPARATPLLTVPVHVEGVPVVAFATLSPEGNLWLAIRDHATTGQEFGRGVIEVQLPAGRAVHHRPTAANEPRQNDAIPVSGDVAAIRFQKASGGDPGAIWFCSSLGVSRFFAGQMSQWGENDGLDSERCHDLEIGPDGVVWAATAAGAARFDGKQWLPFGSAAAAGGSRGKALPWPLDRDGDAVPARALAVLGRDVWAGTSFGIWPLNGGAPPPLARGAGVVDEAVVDMAADRFGRLWTLGHVGVTVRQMAR